MGFHEAARRLRAASEVARRATSDLADAIDRAEGDLEPESNKRPRLSSPVAAAPYLSTNVIWCAECLRRGKRVGWAWKVTDNTINVSKTMMDEARYGGMRCTTHEGYEHNWGDLRDVGPETAARSAGLPYVSPYFSPAERARPQDRERRQSREGRDRRKGD